MGSKGTRRVKGATEEQACSVMTEPAVAYDETGSCCVVRSGRRGRARTRVRSKGS